jgi:hypothetical protein
MWLLGVNLPTALLAVLRSYGIDCDAAASRGWRDLTNGLLVEAAFRAGFGVILTRDRGFGESAGRALRLLPQVAVVAVTLPQARAAAYVAEFQVRWQTRPIAPVAGRVVEWP